MIDSLKPWFTLNSLAVTNNGFLLFINRIHRRILKAASLSLNFFLFFLIELLSAPIAGQYAHFHWLLIDIVLLNQI